MATLKPTPAELEKFGVKGRNAPARSGEAPRRRVVSWVPIRTLKARHRQQILDHLIQLDEHDRYLRFGCQAPLDHISRYVAAIDFKRDEVFGVFNRRLKLVAVAHLAALPQGAGPGGPRVRAMEFGVSVLPESRGRGLGQLLFGHAVMHARNHHANAMMIHALTENRPMIRIAVRAGAKLETDGPESEAWLSLPKDNLGTHLEGSLLALNAELNFRLRRQWLRARGWLYAITHPA